MAGRVNQLVAGYSSPSTYSLRESNSPRSVPLDFLEQIARVQALLVYQIIGLYNGDIGLHHPSESYIPVLNSWKRELVQRASQTACLGGSIISSAPDPKQTAVSLGPSYTAQGDTLLWDSWILAESVRRTWVVSSSIQMIFLALKQGGAPPCQGGMIFTTRKGVWDAKSAVAWEKMCSEVHFGLMQMAEVDRLFTEVRAEEVNEFTKVVLEVILGGSGWRGGECR